MEEAARLAGMCGWLAFMAQKECGWLAFMAQKAQDAHELRHFQIAEQITPDHFTRVLRDPKYWSKISYQEGTTTYFYPKLSD